MNDWDRSIQGGAYVKKKGKNGMTKNKQTFFKKETLKDVLQLKCHAWPERNIRQEVMELFGVRVKLSEFDQSVEKVYYPSYDQNEKLVGFKCKDITKAGEDEEYYTIGKVTKKNQLFGAKQARASAKYLVITEGEVDCLSAYQSMVDYFRTFKDWNENLTPAVVTFSAGAVQAVNHLSHNEKFLKKFQEFRLAMDNDEVSAIEKLTSNTIIRGKECTENVGCYLLTNDSEQGKRDIKVVKLDEDYNDISDYVQVHKGIEIAKQITEKKRLENFSAEKIITVEDITIDELLKPKEKGIYIDSFPLFMDKLWGIRKRELSVFTAMSGVGKCHGRGTKITMADGSKKSVEYIKVGDKVLGIDGTERTVLNTHKGFDQIFTIKQIKGENYTVNSKHLLSLKASRYIPCLRLKKDEIIHISVKDYFKIPPSYRSYLKGFVPGRMEFKNTNCFEPWAIGNWLADGRTKGACISVNVEDTEIMDEWHKIGKKYNYRTEVLNWGKRQNKERTIPLSGGFLQKLKELDLFNNKHVPHEYKFGNSEDRIELLSGILDGDGYLSHNVYEIMFKSKRLCNDIIFIARSLGLRVTYREKFSKCQNFEGRIYHRIFISGDTSILNLRLKRKQAAERRQIKDPLRHGVEIEYSYNGEYFGFEVDGDNLYLLGDFTVTHNTVVSSEIAYKIAESTDEKVAMVYLEENSHETLMRMIARRLKINYYKFVFEPLKYCTREQFEEAYNWVNGKFYFLDVFGSMRVSELMNSFRSLYYVSECSYIIFDHLTLLTANSGAKDERRLIDDMMTELATFTSQTDIGILAVSHLSRQSQTEIGKLSDIKESKWINVRKEHLRGSSSLETLAWNVFGLDMLLEPNRERSDVRISVLKNRSIGFLGVADQFHLNQETGLIELTNQQQGY